MPIPFEKYTTAMIDQQTIDKIYDATQIEEVVGDFVSLRRRGVNMIGHCPFHNEKTPSFIVSPAKGIFKCFGCGKGGNAVHFLMEHEQISYYEALKQLAKKYHIEVVEKELTQEEKQAKDNRESMLLVNQYAQQYFTETLHQHKEGKAVGMSYFIHRGFRMDMIEKFQLGYALAHKTAFTETAIRLGYQKDFLVKTGLTIEGDNYVGDRFRGRVIFPIHSLSGKVIGFGGRILEKADKTAKYLNSPESEIYHKSRELYGIYFAKQSIVKHDRCFIVEGYTDVISMHQSGVENVVSSSGTSLTEGQIRLIHRFTENVTVLYDGDPAGIKASIRGIDLLLSEGMNVKVMLLPDGEDPDSFAQKNNASDFVRKVTENSIDFIRFKCKLLLEDAGDDPIKRAHLISDIVKSISLIPSQIIRSEYIKEAGLLLAVDEKILYGEINKLKKQQHQELLKKNNTPDYPSSDTKKEQQTVSSSPQSVSVLDDKERELLKAVLKYGTMPLYYIEGEQEERVEINVADYIFAELEQDKITFQNPIFDNIKNEYKQKYRTENFTVEKNFVQHADFEVSKVCAELLTEKYVLSKIHAKHQAVENDRDRVQTFVPHLVYEYKLAIVLEKRKEKLAEMKLLHEENNMDKTMLLLEQIKQIDDIKIVLSKELDRVLNLL